MKRGKKRVVKRNPIRNSKRKSNTKEKLAINKRNKNNKKIILSLIVILIVGFFLFILIKNLVLTTKVIEKPYIPENCSNESIKKVWGSVFKGSSENLIIVTPNETALNQITYSGAENLEFGKGVPLLEGCPIYAIYQINGSEVKMLSSMGGFFGAKIVAATSGKFTNETVASIQNLSHAPTNLSGSSQTILWYLDRESSIPTIEAAKSYFESVFNASSSNWTSKDGIEEVTLPNGTAVWREGIHYSFNQSEYASNITLFGEQIDTKTIFFKLGGVNANSSYEYYTFVEQSSLSVLNGLAKKFENWDSPINTSLKNVTIQVNDSKLELLKDYQNLQRVKILQNNETIIEVNVNFTNNFDWTRIILKKQDANSTKGYVIIDGLNFTKNITLDRLNNQSKSVCVKDKEINSISEISGRCNSTNEYLIKCTENLTNLTNSTTNFTCRISNNKFIITGLMNSAVIEILPSEENCISNWACTDWTNYAKTCGYRTCTDSNSCNNQSTMPMEYKECPVCTPDWNCTNFLPEKCPKSEKRTRTCTDLNNCGKDGETPTTTQTCQRKNNLIWIPILIIIAIIILLIILLSRRKNKKITENPQNPPTNQNPEDFKKDPSYPSNLEQGYSSTETDNYKAPVKQTKADEEDYYFPAEQ
jgi:hypothetical protein